MIDVIALDESIKVKAIGRMSISGHPLSTRLWRQVDFSDHFYPVTTNRVDPYLLRSLEILGRIRRRDIGDEKIRYNREYIANIKTVKLKNIVNKRGKLCLVYFSLIRQGRDRIRDLDLREVNLLARFMNASMVAEIRHAKAINDRTRVEDRVEKLNIKGRYVGIVRSSTKDIRECIKEVDPICVLKLGAILSPTECLTWGESLRKVTSVRNRNVLLKVAHGDVFTKEKLHRFGLIDSPLCARCNMIETLQHKIYECEYVARIWRETLNVTNRCKTIRNPNEPIENQILGASTDTSVIILSIHAEVINRILRLRDNDTYLVRPISLLESVIKSLIICEKKTEIKDRLKTLLDGEA